LVWLISLLAKCLRYTKRHQSRFEKRRSIYQFRSSIRYISAVEAGSTTSNVGYSARTEMDSHADTIVAGKNFVVTRHTDRSCDVSPYTDAYEPMKNIRIVQAATGYTSPNGRDYILVVNEALHMPDLPHSLLNPNQLRHYGIIVQDNPYDELPMAITNHDRGFTASLRSKGTTIFLETWHPSQDDLESLPHITLSSPSPWEPHKIQFPQSSLSDRTELESHNINAVETAPVLDINKCNLRWIQGVNVTSEQHTRNIAATSTIPLPGPLHPAEMESPYTFLSKDRHSQTTPEALSERWGISIAQAKLTLKATTRRLVRSALMPLARRYRVDRMFDLPRVRTSMATDTMDARVSSIHGDRYCQIFASKEFFVEAYPIQRKADCHEALDRFIKEYGIPDQLIMDGSGEQTGKSTQFQSIIRKYDIKSKVIEPDRPNQNPAESVIREVRKKWYREMFRTNCPI